MANLKDITGKIVNDANDKVNEILVAARKEAAKIEDEAQEKVVAKRKTALEQAEAQAKINADRILAAAELEGKKQVLAAKQEMISEAFTNAAKHIASLPDKEYDAFMEKLAKGAKGKKEMLPRDKKAGTGGGFIIKDGKIELNYAVEALAKTAKDSMEKEVVSILF